MEAVPSVLVVVVVVVVERVATDAAVAVVATATPMTDRPIPSHRPRLPRHEEELLDAFQG